MRRLVQAALLACWLLVVSISLLPRCSSAQKQRPMAARDDRERERNQRVRYTASWAVEITEGGDKMANLVARRHGCRNLGKVANFDNIYHFVLGDADGEREMISRNAPYTTKSSALLSERSVGFADQQYVRPVYKRSYRVPRDPRFRQQWHLLNTGQYGNEYRGRDLKIEKAWMQGLSGCNITVGIVDDGFEYLHPDLRDNYAPVVSYDFVDGDPDPINNMYDWHGTRCAGLASAAKDGEACGVGVAYNSKFGGLRLLGAFTDLNEASSLSYANDVIDIYSNSWGPCDEGCVDGPQRLTHLALKTGAERGRGGRGSIFVWANGNGGPPDDCAADGYSSSIYTISVGAVGVAGEPSYYDEECSAKMVSAYVTDHNGYSAVSTTATDELCVYGFGGTSASCPMVAGAIALTLEANGNLTWRDVMYLVVFTSNPSLTTGGSYTTNGAGVRFSRKFGFGILDTEAMVARARNWINVPPQLEHIRFPSSTSGRATRSSAAVITQSYTGSITYLEHVVVNLTLIPTGRRDPLRGHISLDIQSPSRTLSTLLKFRSIDNTNRDYLRWPFMSVAFWGENPSGTWRLTIRSQSSETNADYSGLRFQFYGTSITPPAVSRIPARCHSDCARGCAAAGSEFCDVCANLRNAYTMECVERCPPGYTQRNGYCYNRLLPEPVCDSKVLSLTSGSCVEAGYSGCCSDGKCEGAIPSSPFGLCHCDEICHNLRDCCKDIDNINCSRREFINTPMHYMALRSSGGVVTQVVPLADDGVSPVIRIPVPFPIGASLHSAVYVGTNGFFSFDKVFTDYTPFEYPGDSLVTLVSPFFADIDVSKGQGGIRYEVHTLAQSPALFADVNRIINEAKGTTFAGKWLLLAEWNDVPEFGRSLRFTNTFQGIVVTDFSVSYAVFIYKCQDMQFSGSAAIGFTSRDYKLYANHRLSGYSARNIGCVNSGQSDWVNLVYKLTREDLQPVQPTELYDECELDMHNCEQECIDLPTSFVCSCYDGYAITRNGIHCFPYCSADFTAEVGEFNTPSWPESYPQSFECGWNLNLTETLGNFSYFIVFRVDSSAYGMESNCSEEYLEFFDGLSVNATSLGRYCGTTPPQPVATTGLEARVVFSASDEHPDNLRGVRVTYSVALHENECEDSNGGCEHICRDLLYSYTCDCRAGFQLSPNGKNCYDVDECEGSHGCNQVCNNTLGSYQCSCKENFALSEDSRTCLPSCTANYTALSGSFQTPGWPVSYPRLDFTCRWTVDLPGNNYSVRFSVDGSAYGILGTPPCPTEYLQFHDGLTTDTASLGKFCFLDVPSDVLTSSGQALVVFKSTRSSRPASRRGARVTYEAFRLVDECLTDNGGCEHICRDTVHSFTCHCGTGYTLRTDGRSCDDVDECSLGTHSCQQLCINVNGSYTCGCEEGYALNSDGRTCRISCGGNFTAGSGSFHSPGWPTHYPLGFRCEWLIDPANATSNSILSLTVDNSHYGIHGHGSCLTDFLQFHDGNTTSSTSLGVFCFLIPPDTVYTSTSQAVVVFQASRHNHLPSRVGIRVTYQLHTIENECEVDNGGCEETCVNSRTSFECQCGAGYSLATDGFSCEDVDECSLGTHSCRQLCINVNGSYTCGCEEGYALNSDRRTCRISCGGNFTAGSGSFHSPGWPIHYPLDFRCEWLIDPANATSNSILSLTVDNTRYGVHGRTPCSTDYLQFYDDITTAGRSMGVFCGLATPTVHYTSTSRAVVVFQSGNVRQRSNRPGAMVTYQLFELVDECEVNNGGCEGTCVNTLMSFECRCGDGYILATDGLHCEDVNECTGSHSDYCDGLCINTEGSFHCSCSEDFTLGADGRTCLPECGGRVAMDSGSVASPGWPHFYPSLSFSCEWTIETSNDTIISFSFEEEFGILGSRPCRTDYVEIVDGPRGSVSLGKFCSLQVPVSTCSSDNLATVVFQASSNSHSDRHIGVNITFRAINKVNECEVDNGGCEQLCVDLPKSFFCDCRPGYTLASNGRNCSDVDECSLRTHSCQQLCINVNGSYTCGCEEGYALNSDGRTCRISCGGNFTAGSGSFHSPGWPTHYPLGFRCEWFIDPANATSNSILSLTVDNTRYGIHGHGSCLTDFLQFHDGNTTSSTSLGVFCYLIPPDTVYTSTSQAVVVFQASRHNHLPSRVGIRVTYQLHAIENECEVDNGGCEGTCVNSRTSFECQCGAGYSLATDGFSCEDVDECSLRTHSCQQLCINVNGSYTCGCEEGYALNSDGRTCRISCGGNFTAGSGSFHSPGWPIHYPLGFRCEWLIDPANATSNSILSLTVDNTRYGVHGRTPCSTDYLQFYDDITTAGRSMGVFCGLATPTVHYTSTSRAVVVFQSGNIRQRSNRPGAMVTYQLFELVDECEVNNGGCEGTCVNTLTSFECRCGNGYILATDGLHCEDVNECTGSHSDYCNGLCINTEGSFHCSCSNDFTLGGDGRTCLPECGGHVAMDSGSVASPGWPNFYPSLSFSCEWTIETSNDTIISFSFEEEFGILGSRPCRTDYVEIVDGSRGSVSLGKFCSLQVPVSTCSSDNLATVVFQASSNSHSDRHVGVNITFRAINKVNECEVDNGGCEQLCVDLPKSFFCDCRPGYTLASNGRNCSDVDECSQRHGCAERCVNTVGSFHCACNNPDFTVGSDGRSCVPDCGGMLTATTGTFSTPGWPTFYRSLDYRCVWIIEVRNQTNSSLDIVFNERYGIHGSDPCQSDYVEVFDGVGEDTETSRGKFCHLTRPPVISTSSTRATVVFQASTATHRPSRVGVSVTYTTLQLGVNECLEGNGGCEQVCVNSRRSYTCSCTIGYSLDSDGRGCTDVNECSTSSHGCEHDCVNTHGSYLCQCNDGFALGSNGRSCSLDCGGNLPSSNGTFQSPGWPQTYPQLNFRCVWTLENITAGDSVAFVVDKLAFGIQGSSPCVSDYLEFFDTADFSGSSVGRYCSLEAPEPVVIASGGARIVFQGRANRNRGPEYVGARVSYTVLENECAVGNGRCEQSCRDTVFSYECECPQGYQLAADRHTCKDVDECAVGTHECAQFCNNTIGLYTCICGEEFNLAPDGKTCLPACGKAFSFPNDTFWTPGWPHFYPQLDFTCEWTIDISSDYLKNGTRSVLKFVFNESAFGLGDSSNCQRDYIKFYSGTGANAQSVMRICASEVPAPFTVFSTAVRVVFRGSSTPHRPGQVGALVSFFLIEQEFGAAPCGSGEVVDFAGNCREVNCGGTVYSMSGVLQSPNWPEPYSGDSLCQWSIVLPDPDATMRVTVDEIDIYQSRFGICFWDYLLMFDSSAGRGGVPPLLSGRLCGSTPPTGNMVATGNKVHVWYQSSRNRNNRGFSLSFSATV